MIKRLISYSLLLLPVNAFANTEELCQTDIVRPNDEVLVSFYEVANDLDIACPKSLKICNKALKSARVAAFDLRYFNAKCKVAGDWSPPIDPQPTPTEEIIEIGIHCNPNYEENYPTLEPIDYWGSWGEYCYIGDRFPFQYVYDVKNVEIDQSKSRGCTDDTWKFVRSKVSSAKYIQTKNLCEGYFKVTISIPLPYQREY